MSDMEHKDQMKCLRPSEFAEAVEVAKTVLLRPKNRKKWLVVVTGRDGVDYPLCDNWRKPVRFGNQHQAHEFAVKQRFAVTGVVDQTADYVAAVEKVPGLKGELVHACGRFRGGRGLFPAAVRRELEFLGRAFLRPSSLEWSELHFLIEFYASLASAHVNDSITVNMEQIESAVECTALAAGRT